MATAGPLHDLQRHFVPAGSTIVGAPRVCNGPQRAQIGPIDSPLWGLRLPRRGGASRASASVGGRFHSADRTMEGCLGGKSQLRDANGRVAEGTVVGPDARH